MRLRLGRRHALVEQVQLLVLAIVASPAEVASYGCCVLRAAAQRRQGIREALLVMTEELIDSGVRRGADRTVGRKQAEVGQSSNASK